MDILQIYSYKDSARSQELACFKSQVNPGSLRMFSQNQYGKQYPINAKSLVNAFTFGGPNYIEFTLVLDGTGMLASKDDKPISVVDQVKALTSCIMTYVGETHQPPYLKLVWGHMPIFYCRAEKCDLTYKTLNSDGEPVRADAKLTLLEDIDEELEKRMANPSSPDLYHYHLVSEKDSLPYLSYLYYRSPNYCQHIASANNLPNLYHLKVDHHLVIPPLDKGATAEGTKA